MSKLILTCNAGSNSLKCALYEVDGKTSCYHYAVDNIHQQASASITDNDGNIVFKNEPIEPGYENALSFFYGWFEDTIENHSVIVAGHRIVHGGQKYTGPVKIDENVRKDLESLIPFAPLHQPYNLKLIDILEDKIPGLTQIACFDTAFHQQRPLVAQQFALPRKFMEEESLYRYGFHGLSYDYIANVLPSYFDNAHNKKVIAVHLGGGASACAMQGGKSIETTMGFSALEGLMMATRCGRLDPGVVLHLIQKKKMSAEDVETMLYKESGLLGVSGISGDMRDLESNPDKAAQEAVNLFCYMAAREIGGLIPPLGGVDALVFTGAMGKNSAIIRQQICSYLSWLPLEIHEAANNNDSDIISSGKSDITVLALETDEEAIIAKQTAIVFGNND